MPLFAENEDKIFGEVLYSIVNDTNIRRSSPGSKTRAIAKAMSNKMGQMYRKFDVNIAQAFLDGATGKYLEFIGDMMGVARLGNEPARVTSAERNIRFYVDVGTFGDINGGNPILIPSGTIISTSEGGTGVSYQVPYNVILSSSSSQQYVAVQSIRAGSAQNVGSKQLVFHTFTNYTDSANNTLKVTNDAEVVNAQDVETDVNYRFRIAQQVIASEAANQTAIRIAALSVPGVADIVYIPFHRGVGTFDLLIKSTTANVSDGLIATVSEAVSKVTALGNVPNVRGPTETGMSVVGTLTMKRKLSVAEETSIIQAVQANVTEYINSLDIGEEFIVNEAVERVMSTSDLIKNVGVAGKPFDSLYIYKPTRLEDNKVRNTLLGDYAPEVDERVIVENRYAGSTPILFRTA